MTRDAKLDLSAMVDQLASGIAAATQDFEGDTR